MLTGRYIATILAITIVTIAVGVVLWNSEEQQLLTDTGDATCDGWCLGPLDAPIIIETFTDFECHICVDKERFVMQAMERYPGQIRFVYHHYPYSDFSYNMDEALEAALKPTQFINDAADSEFDAIPNRPQIESAPISA